MLDHVDRERSLEMADAPSRIPVRKLALLTGLTCLVAQVLTQAGGGSGDAEHGPLAVVLGQALWNAAQVGFLMLLLCLWRADRRWWLIAIVFMTLASLPFAIYALSPGAWALTALLLATCALPWVRAVPDLDVVIADSPARGPARLATLEFLAFTCNLLCSMYNFNASRTVWPYWAGIFLSTGAFLGLTSEPAAIPSETAAIVQDMYTLGFDGVSMPSFVRVGGGLGGSSSLGAVIFALIWTILPFLYVLYFAVLAKLAKNSYGTRLQQALCLFGIVHFLFLTDIVDYRFGRGIANEAAEWCHWAERFAWRIAILLPIYQKLTTLHWRKGNGLIGVVLHYTLAIWAAGFLVLYVLMGDVPGFGNFAMKEIFAVDKLSDVARSPKPPKLAAPPKRVEVILPPDGRWSHRMGYIRAFALGYPQALVLMTFLYGFMVLAMRRKRIFAISISPHQRK